VHFFIREETGANSGAEPLDAGGAGATGVSEEGAQAEDEAVGEEAFYEDLATQQAEESDDDRFADPWNEYFAFKDDNLAYELDADPL
jgi:hypothetical protein